MVLHGIVLRQNADCLANGKKEHIVRAYGIKDNPKKTWEENGSFLNGGLRNLTELNSLDVDDIWVDEDHSLYGKQSFILLPKVRKKRSIGQCFCTL